MTPKQKTTNQTTCIPTQTNTYQQTLISGVRRTQRTRRPGRRVHHRGAQETVRQAKGTKKGAAPEGKGGRAGQREEPVRAMQKPHNRKERDSPDRRRGQKQKTRGKQQPEKRRTGDLNGWNSASRRSRREQREGGKNKKREIRRTWQGHAGALTALALAGALTGCAVFTGLQAKDQKKAQVTAEELPEKLHMTEEEVRSARDAYLGYAQCLAQEAAARDALSSPLMALDPRGCSRILLEFRIDSDRAQMLSSFAAGSLGADEYRELASLLAPDTDAAALSASGSGTRSGAKESRTRLSTEEGAQRTGVLQGADAKERAGGILLTAPAAGEDPSGSEGALSTDAWQDLDPGMFREESGDADEEGSTAAPWDTEGNASDSALLRYVYELVTFSGSEAKSGCLVTPVPAGESAPTCGSWEESEPAWSGDMGTADAWDPNGGMAGTAAGEDGVFGYDAAGAEDTPYGAAWGDLSDTGGSGQDPDAVIPETDGAAGLKTDPGTGAVTGWDPESSAPLARTTAAEGSLESGLTPLACGSTVPAANRWYAEIFGEDGAEDTDGWGSTKPYGTEEAGTATKIENRYRTRMFVEVRAFSLDQCQAMAEVVERAILSHTADLVVAGDDIDTELEAVKTTTSADPTLALLQSSRVEKWQEAKKARTDCEDQKVSLLSRKEQKLFLALCAEDPQLQQDRGTARSPKKGAVEGEMQDSGAAADNKGAADQPGSTAKEEAGRITIPDPTAAALPAGAGSAQDAAGEKPIRLAPCTAGSLQGAASSGAGAVETMRHPHAAASDLAKTQDAQEQEAAGTGAAAEVTAAAKDATVAVGTLSSPLSFVKALLAAIPAFWQGVLERLMAIFTPACLFWMLGGCLIFVLTALVVLSLSVENREAFWCREEIRSFTDLPVAGRLSADVPQGQLRRDLEETAGNLARMAGTRNAKRLTLLLGEDDREILLGKAAPAKREEALLKLLQNRLEKSGIHLAWQDLASFRKGEAHPGALPGPAAKEGDAGGKTSPVVLLSCREGISGYGDLREKIAAARSQGKEILGILLLSVPPMPGRQKRREERRLRQKIRSEQRRKHRAYLQRKRERKKASRTAPQEEAKGKSKEASVTAEAPEPAGDGAGTESAPGRNKTKTEGDMK